MRDEDALVDGARDEFDVAMRLLSDGVPLSLLIDLALPPHSDEIYQAEPGNATWLLASAV